MDASFNPHGVSQMRIKAMITVLMCTSVSTCLPIGQASAQEEVPTSDSAARSIMERTNAFYRGLPTVSCTAEVWVRLGENAVDDKIGMRALAVRPQLVSIDAVEPHGYFPTNQFVSDGKTLFELSIRRQMFMLSDASSDLSSLHGRAARRSAPNIPVESFLALLSDRPIENLLRLDVEPGLIRLAGEVEVDGVACQELVVNEGGSRVWIRSESPHWVVRYRNSPVTALPRYLPKGARVTGPDVQVDFKTWSMSPPDKEDWSWQVPEGYVRMATMHESADGGPEDGYDSLLLDENKGTGTGVAAGNGAGLMIGPNRQGPARRPKGPSTGVAAPEVELVGLDGTSRLLSELRGERPAVLVFWRKDDKFARTGFPRMLGSLRSLGDSVSVIPIGSGEDEDAVAWMIDWNPLFAGSMKDPGSIAADTYDVAGEIAVVLVDHEGVVRHVYIGANPRLDAVVLARTRNLVRAAVAAEDDSTAGDGSGPVKD